MKRSRKKYERPLRPWDKQRIEREKELLKQFGLTKKQEIWIAEGILRKYRRMVRELIAKPDKAKEKTLIDKLIKVGILGENATLDDILNLSLENILDRRLQSVISRKGLANTFKQARQLITHGKVRIDKRKIIYPSYLVPKNEEDRIEVVGFKVSESGKSESGKRE
jgi:small subunit ribosomal protein S4